MKDKEKSPTASTRTGSGSENESFSPSLMIALEPRIMFDGAALVSADPTPDDTATPPPATDDTDSSSKTETESKSSESDSSEPGASDSSGETGDEAAEEQTGEENSDSGSDSSQASADSESESSRDESLIASEPAGEDGSQASESDDSDSGEESTDDDEEQSDHEEKDQDNTAAQQDQPDDEGEEEQLAAAGYTDSPREIVFVDSSVNDYELILAGLEYKEAPDQTSEDNQAEYQGADDTNTDTADDESADGDGGEDEEQDDLDLASSQFAASEDTESTDTRAENPYGVPDGVMVVILDSDRDGLEQISETMAMYQGVAAVHIISHGDNGKIRLGNTVLSNKNIDQYSEQLATIGRGLTESGDILIYGCDVAESEDGQALLNKMADATGADVAGSTDNTGSGNFNGDWELEYSTGAIEAGIRFVPSQMPDYVGALDSVTVTTFADVLDGDTSSIAALEASPGTDGFISLREAIIAANNTAGDDTIFLDAGTYLLDETGNDDNSVGGDLDITDGVTIMGDGDSGFFTIEQTVGGQRVFEIHANAGNVSFDGDDGTIRITGGDTNSVGGGIRVLGGNVLNLDDTIVFDNEASSGGGIHSFGSTIFLNDGAVIAGNRAVGDGSGSGGGINIAQGTLNMRDDARVEFNQADFGGGIRSFDATVNLDDYAIVEGNMAAIGGGIHHSGGFVNLNDCSAVVYNQATLGGGIFNAQFGTITVNDAARVNYNVAFEDGGGIYNQGQVFVNADYGEGFHGEGFFCDVEGEGTSGEGFELGLSEGYDAGYLHALCGGVEPLCRPEVNYNFAGRDGGGVYNTGDFSSEGGDISYNTAGGGDVKFQGTTPSYTGSGSFVFNGEGSFSGGFGASDAALFTVAGGNGGGIANVGGTVDLIDTLVSHNRAVANMIGVMLFSVDAGFGFTLPDSGGANIFGQSIDVDFTFPPGFGLNALRDAGNGGGIFNAEGGIVNLWASEIAYNEAGAIPGESEVSHFVNSLFTHEDVGITLTGENSPYSEGTVAEGLSIEGGFFAEGLFLLAGQGGNGGGIANIDGWVNLNGEGLQGEGLCCFDDVKCCEGDAEGPFSEGYAEGFQDGFSEGLVDGFLNQGNRVHGNEANGISASIGLFAVEGTIDGTGDFEDTGEGSGEGWSFTGSVDLEGLQNTSLAVGIDLGVVNSALNLFDVELPPLPAFDEIGLGGGIYNEYTGTFVADPEDVLANGMPGTVNVNGSYVEANRAVLGGGIANVNGWLNLDGSSVSYNTAFGDGGGIYNRADMEGEFDVLPGSVFAQSTTIDHNVAGAPFVIGFGPLFTEGFISNFGGEGFCCDDPEFFIQQDFETIDLFAMVGLGGRGGGIFNDGGDVELVDSSVSGNVANGAFLGIGVGDGIGSVYGTGDLLFPEGGGEGFDIEGNIVEFSEGIRLYSNDLFGDIFLAPETAFLIEGLGGSFGGLPAFLAGLSTQFIAGLFTGDGPLSLEDLPGILDDVGGFIDDIGFFDAGLGLGGGIYNTGTTTLVNTTVAYNRAGAADLHSASGPGGMQTSGVFAAEGFFFTDGPGDVGLPPSVFYAEGPVYDFSGPFFAFAAGGNGGGIYNDFGDLFVTEGSLIQGNEAADGYFGLGMFNGEGSIRITQGSIYDDDLGGEGSVLTAGRYESWIDLPTLDVRGSIFREGVGQGGGIYNVGEGAILEEVDDDDLDQAYTGRVYLTDGASVEGNVATDGGGIYNRSYVEARGEAFIGFNDARRNGGGVYNDGREGDVETFGGDGFMAEGSALLFLDNNDDDVAGDGEGPGPVMMGNRAGMQTFVFGEGGVLFEAEGFDDDREEPGAILDTSFNAEGFFVAEGFYVAYAPGGDGGAVYNNFGTVLAEDALFAGNQAFGAFVGEGFFAFGAESDFDGRVFAEGGLFDVEGFDTDGFGNLLFGDYLGGFEALPFGVGSAPFLFEDLFDDNFFVPEGFFAEGFLAEGSLSEGFGDRGFLTEGVIADGGDGGVIYNLGGRVEINNSLAQLNEAGAIHDLSTIFADRDLHRAYDDLNNQVFCGCDLNGEGPNGPEGLPDTFALDNAVFFDDDGEVVSDGGPDTLGVGLFNISLQDGFRRGGGEYFVEGFMMGIGSGGNGGVVHNDGGDVQITGSTFDHNVAQTYRAIESEFSTEGITTEGFFCEGLKGGGFGGGDSAASFEASGLVDSFGVIDFLPEVDEDFSYGLVMEARFDTEYENEITQVLFDVPFLNGAHIDTVHSPYVGVNGQGGAIWNGSKETHGAGAFVSIEDSLLSENQAYVGGAIANLEYMGEPNGIALGQAEVQVDNSAIVLNQAIRAGGGVFNFGFGEGIVCDDDVLPALEAENLAEGFGEGFSEGFGAIVDINESLVEGNSAGGLWKMNGELRFHGEGEAAFSEVGSEGEGSNGEGDDGEGPDALFTTEGDLTYFNSSEGASLRAWQIDGDGGGIFNWGGWTNVSNSNVDDNRAYGAFLAEGDIYLGEGGFGAGPFGVGFYGDGEYSLSADVFRTEGSPPIEPEDYDLYLVDFDASLEKGTDFYLFSSEGLRLRGPLTNGIAEGGGIYSGGEGLVTVESSTVNDNQAGVLHPDLEAALFGEGSLLSGEGSFAFAGDGVEADIDGNAPGFFGEGVYDAQQSSEGFFIEGNFLLRLDGLGGNGGGAFNEDATLVIDESDVNGNLAQGDLHFRAEGFFAEGGSGGFQSEGPGEIAVEGVSFDFEDQQFALDPFLFQGEGVFAVGGESGNGGGVYNGGCGRTYLFLDNVNENTALVGGGLFNTDHGFTYVGRSLFAGNEAVIGGGMANGTQVFGVGHGDTDHSEGTSTLVAVNTTLSGNRATGDFIPEGFTVEGLGIYGEGYASEGFGEGLNTGGGLHNGIHGATLLINDTFTLNEADWGGGIFNEPLENGDLNGILCGCESEGPLPAAGEIFIGNTIVGENIAQFNGNDVLGEVVTQGHNLITDPVGSTGFDPAFPGPHDRLGVSPVLGPLQDNGGRTHTHALLDDSPAIDAGDPALLDTFGHWLIRPFDQRGEGFPREINRVDIGAYERGAPPPPLIPTPTGPGPTSSFVPPPLPPEPPTVFSGGRNEHFNDHENSGAYPRVSRPIEIHFPLPTGGVGLGADFADRFLGVTYSNATAWSFVRNVFNLPTGCVDTEQEVQECVPEDADLGGVEDGDAVEDVASTSVVPPEGAMETDRIEERAEAAPGFSAQLLGKDRFSVEQNALLAAIGASCAFVPGRKIRPGGGLQQ